MNVLHLQTELNITCGVSKFIFLIAKNLNDEFNHHIITMDGDGIERFKKNNLKVTVLKYNRRQILSTVFLFYSLLQYCKKNDIDLIHSHHRYFDFLASFLSKFLGIPTVMTVHSKVMNLKLFSYKSDYFVAVSDAVKKHLTDYFAIPSEKLYVINNFVDPYEVNIKIDREKLKKALNIPNSKYLIGFIGRINISEKGIDILLEAFSKLFKENNEIFLLIIGKGEDSNYVKNFLENNWLPALFLPAEFEIFQYLNICDLCVLPSRIDPFPLIMLEAGLMQKTFIGSNVDGIAEFIDHGINGLLFEPEDVEELISCIKKILFDKERSIQLGKNLFNKVMNGFTSNNIIPEYKKIYHQLKNANK